MRLGTHLAAVLAAAALGGCGAAGTNVGTVGATEPLAVKETRYQVTATKTAPTVQDRYETRAAKGEFLLVTMKVTLGGEQGRPFRKDAAKLLAPDGTSHEVDVQASGMVDPRMHLLGEVLERDRPKTGMLVFDVPKGGSSGARLQLEDLRSSDYGSIELAP